MHIQLLMLIMLLGLPLIALGDNELLSMDLEQLMEMNVTTVSKREQSLSSAAAAIHTITNNDIRRSGATTLPDVLRQAPGIEVARLNTSLWAVTARGFNSQFANKLLILVDGRTVYTPLFSGTYWDDLLPPLEDIQRIEIIRGPGASVWGSNAVNGIINIITYDTEQTQGGQLTTGAGNEEAGFARTRYGFRQGNLNGRVNAQYRKTDELQQLGTARESADDAYHTAQAGFRFDWNPDITDKLTLDGGFSEAQKQLMLNISSALQPYVMPRDQLHADSTWLLGNWLHQRENEDSLFLQAYITHNNRRDALYDAKTQAMDVEFQYNHHATDTHRVTWGLNYRDMRDDIDGSFILDYPDGGMHYSQSTTFLQDEYSITQQLALTSGIKLEDGDLGDKEYQPSVRLTWQPSTEATWWSSISRATRVPSRSETSMILRSPIPGYLYPSLENPAQASNFIEVRGSDNFASETLYAYETGVRLQASESLFIDAATFINEYRDLRSYEEVVDTADSDADFVFQYGNRSLGRSEGAELATDYRPGGRWRLKTAYTYFNFDTRSNESIVNQNSQPFEFTSPQHQIHLTSYHDLAEQWQLDWTVHHVTALYHGFIPEYTDMDMRLSYAVQPDLRFSLVGKDLAGGARMEFVDTNYGPLFTEIQRSIYLQMEWR